LFQVASAADIAIVRMLADSGRAKQSAAANLLARLRRYTDEMLRFSPRPAGSLRQQPSRGLHSDA